MQTNGVRVGGVVIVPARGKVVVEESKRRGERMGSMLLADTIASKIPPCQGKVVAVGDGVSRVRKGDRVVYGFGTAVPAVGDMVLLRENQVVCTIE